MIEVRNEWEAACEKYQEVLEWEAQFAAEIENARIEDNRQAILAWESQFAAEIEASNHEETSTIVTMYHGTWNKNIQFGEMEIQNYNSIGTWTTEGVERAEMYGAYIIEVKATVNNAYQVEEDFFQFFGGDDKMMNGQYVKELKEKLVAQRYDAIMFKDSKIDLGSNEGTQTAIVLLNPSEQIVEYKYI